MTPSIIIQQPQGPANRLLVLFHGIGADARNMVLLGRLLAGAFADAWVVSVNGAHPSDLGAGRQ